VSGAVDGAPDRDGDVISLRAGDAAIFPRGWTGTYTVCAPLRTVYAPWEAR